MRRNRAALLALLAAFCSHTSAQQDVPASPPSERAKRDAEKPFQWILMQSDKPRKARDEKVEKPAPAVVVVVPRPARPPEASTARPATTTAGTEVAQAASASAAAAPAASGAGAAFAAPNPTATDPTLTIPAVNLPAPRSEPEPTPKAAEPESDPGPQPLALVTQVDPEFSGTTMRSLRKGEVQVRFEVRPDGSVGQPEVVKTSHPRLNAAALAAVAQWRFQPIQRAQTGIVQLGFNLD